MKKILYIIPGYGHTTKMPEYANIGACARDKGYNVSFILIDWNLPISRQVVNLKKEDVVFGFSLGAVIAKLSYGETPCKRIILGSETPLYKLTKRDILQATSKNIIVADDLLYVKKKIALLKFPSVSCIYLSGEHERLRGRKIKGAGHKLTKKYIQAICNLL